MTKHDQNKILEILDKMKNCNNFHCAEISTVIKRLNDRYPDKKDTKNSTPKKFPNLK